MRFMRWRGQGRSSYARTKNERYLDRQSALQCIRNKKSCVLVVGMFDTGTNLMTALLHDHASETLGLDLLSERRMRKERTFPAQPFWKHTLPRDLERAQKGWEYTTLIVMVRNPLAHVVALDKQAYDLNACKNHWKRNHYSPFCTRKCTMRAKHTVVPAHTYADVWNAYMHDVVHVLPTMGFKNIVVVRYEDVVLHTSRELDRTLHAQNLTVPHKAMKQSCRPAKNHGKPHTHAQAKAILMKHGYTTHLSPREFAGVCHGLNRTLLRTFGYEGACFPFQGIDPFPCSEVPLAQKTPLG